MIKPQFSETDESFSEMERKPVRHIFVLEHLNKDAIKRIAFLHQLLMPTSPVAALGNLFMEKFYYSRLINDRLIRCNYYKYDNKIVGFIVYTDDPEGFLRQGILKNLFIFCPIILTVFLKNPKKFTQVVKASQLEHALKTKETGEGAILSFGVLPEYRDRKFINKTGLLISNELFEDTVKLLKQKRIRNIRFLIEPDNREAMVFYMQYGCKFEKINTLGRSLIKVSYTF